MSSESDSNMSTLDDEDVILEQWFSFHREPTLNYPADIKLDRQEVVRLKARVQALQNIYPRPIRDLAVAQKFYELSCWRIFRFNSLPDDLILHIFRQGTFCSPDNKCGPTMPLLYSHVCKRWRQLALDASWLWSFIAFGERPPYKITQAFLERSKSSPLIIELDITDPKFDYEDDAFWPSATVMTGPLSVLVPHIGRWKSLFCCADNRQPLNGVLDMLQPLAAPILKSIEFKQNFNYLILPERTQPYILLGGGAPALQNLLLSTIPIDWRHLSFSNLSELDIHRITMDFVPTVQDFWALLHQSPNLRRLSLIDAGPQWDEGQARMLPTIELLRLEELELIGAHESPCDVNYALFVLSMIRPGPALLSLEFGVFSENSDFNLVVPVLHKYFRQVERLLLLHLNMDVAIVARWLHAMPNVKYLSVYGQNMQNSLFEALGTPAEEFCLETREGVLCPSLQILSPCNPEPAVRDIVLRRKVLGAPLTTLRWHVNMMEDVAENLANLEEVVDFVYEGVQIDSEDEWVGPDPYDWPMEDGASI